MRQVGMGPNWRGIEASRHQGIKGPARSGGCTQLAVAVVTGLIAAAWFDESADAGAPPYDNCANALEVFVGETAFTNIDSTIDGPPACAQFSGKDVWFRFTPTFNGDVIISTCDDADFDTIIAVYSGCGCGTFSLINCNDEACPADHTSSVEIAVQAYQCYRIRVIGFNSDEGNGVLSISCKPIFDFGGIPRINSGCAEQKAEGAEPNDRFGTALSRGGRMNAGTKDEIVAAAPFNDHGGNNRGRVYALKGETLANLYTFTGVGNADKFGTSVSSVGDLNNDGRPDIVVGAPFNDGTATNAGKVWAFSGLNGSQLWNKKGARLGDRFGHAVSIVGDANDDGFDDVLVGAPWWDAPTLDNCGRAYLLDGETGVILWTVNGQTAGENFGFAVAGVGDPSEDGKADVAVGAPGHTSGRGKVSFFSGPDRAVLQRITGDAAGDRFGEAIAGGDFTVGITKFTYVAIGSPHNGAGGANAGRFRLYTRNHTTAACGTMLCAAGFENGPIAGAELGTSLSIGQLFGTAHPELLVGVPGYGLNGANAGGVFMYDLFNTSLAARIIGEAASDRFGTTVALAGDIDGDTDVDFAAGAPFSDAAGNDAGRVYVFYNSTVPAPGLATGPRFADVNRDGVVDSADLVKVITAFGACPSGQACESDVDHSGTVDAGDLLRVIVEMN